MEFCTQFPQLAPREQARFKSVVTRLWAGDVIMPGPPMKPDADWTFVERYHPLVASYLAMGDWELQLRQKPPMARAVHPSGKLRATFNKFQSVVTLVLRLAYHEQMGQSYDREECTLTVAELRDRLHQEGLPLHQLSGRKLRDTLRLLHRHQIVDIPWGFRGVDDEHITISPVIETILPENIAAFRDMLTKYAVARGAGGADAEDDEADDRDDRDTSDDPPRARAHGTRAGRSRAGVFAGAAAGGDDDRGVEDDEEDEDGGGDGEDHDDHDDDDDHHREWEGAHG